MVEELNKSVEQWVGSVKPLPSVMHKVINQISRFMAEFSKLAKSSPRFLRVGVDLHSMALFGISFDEIKADIAVNHLSLTSSGDTNDDKDDDRVTESKLLEPVYKEGPPQFPTDAMVQAYFKHSPSINKIFHDHYHYLTAVVWEETVCLPAVGMDSISLDCVASCWQYST